MKIRIHLWTLSYASIDNDGELFVDTLGLYETKADAVKAMEDNVSQDIEDGDDKDKWDINGNQATYVDDFSNTNKQYSIKLF